MHIKLLNQLITEIYLLKYCAIFIFLFIFVVFCLCKNFLRDKTLAIYLHTAHNTII